MVVAYTPAPANARRHMTRYMHDFGAQLKKSLEKMAEQQPQCTFMDHPVLFVTDDSREPQIAQVRMDFHPITAKGRPLIVIMQLPNGGASYGTYDTKNNVCRSLAVGTLVDMVKKDVGLQQQFIRASLISQRLDSLLDQ